jgi:exosortase/archaeosortase family protein
VSTSSTSRKLVGALSFCLLVWFVVDQSGTSSTPQSRLILWTGAFFALLIVVRREASLDSTLPSVTFLSWAAGTGALLAVTGIVTGIHQFQWLGLLLMTYSGLRWSLPEIYSGKVASALFVLYWAHPLPGNLFGGVRLAMQRISVAGAEWCLHSFNIPVWADGLILRTGFRAFEVPEACSGMNTAMIVVVCALGSGALLDLSMAKRMVLMGAGFIQVLIMNAIRIALMIGLARNAPPGWSDRYLHDSTAALLLMMIVLIQGEAALWCWQGRQTALLRGRRHAHQLLSYVLNRVSHVHLPRFEMAFFFVMFLVLMFSALFVLDRRSPTHRAEMISRVAEELAQHDLEQAERAAYATVSLGPTNLAHGVLLARIRLMRGKHEEALFLLRQLQPLPKDHAVIQLTAWGLLGSGKLEEAQKLIRGIPTALAIHPGMAMFVAELAVMQGDAARAASNVVIAATWSSLTERVRRLYPFLAQHGKWDTIVRSNDPSPYRDTAQFRIALVAAKVENNLAQTIQLLQNNRALWFGKPSFLPHLQELVLRYNDPSCLGMFADSLTHSMEQLSPDELNSYLEPCFLLGRPDLAWIAYRRLSRVDPLHPALSLIPARFASGWYAFRGDRIGLSAPNPSPLNLRLFLKTSARWSPYRQLVENVPLGSLMLDGPTPARISGWMMEGMSELARRRAGGTLSYDGYALYERALQWTGRTNETLGLLASMERQFPDRHVEILALRGKYYRALGDWQSLYETLRQIRALRPHLDQDMHRVLTETLVETEMGVCALTMSEAELKRRPDDRAARLMLASLWERFGFTEESLFVLRPLPDLPPSESLAALLRKTGRYEEAAQMMNMIGKPREADYRPMSLPMLAPAESVLVWAGQNGKASPFSREVLDRQLQKDTSPFLLKLHQMTRDWLILQKHEHLADPILWKAIGRDTMEQVTALHRLAFLAAEAGNLPASRQALDDALQLMPSARLLWRMRIAVAGQEAGKIIAMARRACPEDSEIWLASLVVDLRNNRKEAAVTALRNACERSPYSPATLVRAGYALLRAGDADSAALAAKSATTMSRHFLPARLLGLDAALAAKDTRSAVSYALHISDLAPDPVPFLQVAVRLGMTQDAKQTSLTRALESLISLEPDNPEWSLRLGTVYFKSALFQLARDAFGRWLLYPPADTDPNMLIMMAESARRSEDLPGSLTVLREAFRRFPSNAHVINSLAWTLAQTPPTVEEARSFLPRLMDITPTVSILDTIATIHLRSANLEAAQHSIKEAVDKIKPGDSYWSEIHVTAAEIECALGRASEAEKLLKTAYDSHQSNKALLDKRIVALEIKIRDLKQGARK